MSTPSNDIENLAALETPVASWNDLVEKLRALERLALANEIDPAWITRIREDAEKLLSQKGGKASTIPIVGF